MNRGKFDTVTQEMTRVNTDILGITELKCTGMGEFNSDDHYIYYCGQESFTGNGVALIVNRRVQNAVFECSLKNDRMISVCHGFCSKEQASFNFMAAVITCSEF